MQHPPHRTAFQPGRGGPPHQTGFQPGRGGFNAQRGRGGGGAGRPFPPLHQQQHHQQHHQQYHHQQQQQQHHHQQQQQQQQQAFNQPKVFNVAVSKVATEISEQLLIGVLACCGRLEKWNRPRDPATNQFKSFGIGSFRTADAAALAVTLLNGLEMSGQAITVKVGKKEQAAIEPFVDKEKMDASQRTSWEEKEKAARQQLDNVLGRSSSSAGGGTKGDEAKVKQPNSLSDPKPETASYDEDGEVDKEALITREVQRFRQSQEERKTKEREQRRRDLSLKTQQMAAKLKAEQEARAVASSSLASVQAEVVGAPTNPGEEGDRDGLSVKPSPQVQRGSSSERPTRRRASRSRSRSRSRERGRDRRSERRSRSRSTSGSRERRRRGDDFQDGKANSRDRRHRRGRSKDRDAGGSWRKGDNERDNERNSQEEAQQQLIRAARDKAEEEQARRRRLMVAASFGVDIEPLVGEAGPDQTRQSPMDVSLSSAQAPSRQKEQQQEQPQQVHNGKQVGQEREAARPGFQSLRAESAPSGAKRSIGLSLSSKTSKAGVNQKGHVRSAFDVEEDSEATRSKPVVPIDYSEEEKMAVASLEERERMRARVAQQQQQQRATPQVDPKKEREKALVDSIPKTKEELFAYPINWEVVESKNLLEGKIRPWIMKKVVEYLGEEEKTLIEFIMTKLGQRSRAEAILEELKLVLEEDAETFITKMWRMLVFCVLRAQ